MGIGVVEALFLAVILDGGIEAIAKEINVPLDGLLGDLPGGGEIEAVGVQALPDLLIQFEQSGKLGLVALHTHPSY